MPASDDDLVNDPIPRQYAELPFPPVTRSHILHCSYHFWHQRYRSITPKARLIRLSPAFVSYLRADGIVLPADDEPRPQSSDSDDGIFSKDEDGSEDEDEDPSVQWRDIHESIKRNIVELGGKVAPKLNWSAPKDATWINATNSMDCRTPNDIYLLLKSSDFVTHDLECAFDGCVDSAQSTVTGSNLPSQDTSMLSEIPYYLVLRKHILINPAVEFRCFVRRRKLLGICQRDLNHFDFLFEMQENLCDSIQDFFDQKLRDTFPDENFAFDVYIPPPHQRVWLMDINPWAPRTDPLLFSWLELLTMPEPTSGLALNSTNQGFVRLSMNASGGNDAPAGELLHSSDEEDVEAEFSRAEFRLIKKDDPEAYNFNTPQYSAHKLPRDVVEASQGGAGSLREFAEQWKEVLARRQQDDADAESDEE